MREVARHESAARTAQPSSFVSLLSGWIQQGMESFFATQKILMDVATRQNANAMKVMRETISDPKHSPAAILKELVVEGTANFIEAQRVLLDLGQRENEILLNGVKERVGTSATAAAMTDLVRRSIDTFLEMQQEFLTIANRQAELLMKSPKGSDDQTHMINLAREGMEKFVGAQKQFLDVIAEETEKMTSSKAPRQKETKPKDLPKLAHESALAMVDAQKKLLDLTAQQMNVNMQMATRATEMFTPFRVPIARITGDGVRDFVDAEKALIDTMVSRRHQAMKTTTATAKKTKTKRPVKRATTKRKPQAQAAHAG